MLSKGRSVAPPPLLLLLLLLLVLCEADQRRPKRFLAFRKGSSFFYRLNYKVNMLPYTTMFAQASGFKVGWQLPESHGSSAQRLSARELGDGARLLYDSHGFDGSSCLMKSLCQSMQLASKRDGVMAKILKLMAGSNRASNATLDAVVCEKYANRCPLHLLDFPAAFAHH